MRKLLLFCLIATYLYSCGITIKKPNENIKNEITSEPTKVKQTAKYETYNYFGNGNFSISIPKDWEVEKDVINTSLVVTHVPENDFSYNINHVVNGLSTTEFLYAFKQNQFSLLKQHAPSLKWVSDETTVMNGYNCTHIKIKGYERNISVALELYYFHISNNNSYLITFSMNGNNEESNKMYVNTIVNSFKAL